jgi:hypothetical protein
MVHRGYYSRSLAFAAVNTVCNELGFEALPQHDNYASCLEDSVFSLVRGLMLVASRFCGRKDVLSRV